LECGKRRRITKENAVLNNKKGIHEKQEPKSNTVSPDIQSFLYMGYQ
jgi:hypothetical protein